MTWDRTLGCPYIAGPACGDCDGSCWEPQQAGPTPEEHCAGIGHPPYAERDGIALCYCGARIYPAAEADRDGER